MSSIDWKLSWRSSEFLDMYPDNLHTNSFLTGNTPDGCTPIGRDTRYILKSNISPSVTTTIFTSNTS